MQLRKIALIFLVVIMMLSLAATFVAAEETGSDFALSAKLECETAISKDPFVVKPGDIIEFVVSLDANPGNISSLEIYVDFDNKALEYLGLASEDIGDLFEKDTTKTQVNKTTTEEANNDGELYVWFLAKGSQYSCNTTGEFVTLRFKVSETFDGDIDELDLTMVKYRVPAVSGQDSGFRQYTSYNETPVIKAHNYAAPELVPGDCVTATKHLYTCACGDELYVDVEAPAGHSYVFNEELPATCVTPGFAEHYRCSVCQKYFAAVRGEDDSVTYGEEVFENDLVIQNGGHTFDKFNDVVLPECETTGTEAHYVCTGCGQLGQKAEGSDEFVDVDADDLVLSAKGHNYGEFKNEVPATCTATGVAAHYNCADCGKNFDADYKELDTIELPQLPHNKVLTEMKAPVCEVAGHDAYYSCAACNQYWDVNDQLTTFDELVLAALEHVPGTVIEYKAPTAAEFGFKAHSLCTRECGQYFDANGNKTTYEELLIDKLPPEMQEADDAWVKGDSDAVVEFKSDAHIDDFVGFWFNGKLLEEGKDYTVRAGSIIVTLTEDFLATLKPGESYKVGIESTSGTATTTFEVTHDYGSLVEYKNATCTVNGNLAYYYCGASCCNTYFDANKEVVAENATALPESLVIKAPGHTPAGPKIPASDPTCTGIGYMLDCFKCSVCDGYYKMNEDNSFTDYADSAIEIPALGHNVKKVEAKAPTCEDKGNIEHYFCDRCECTLDENNNVIDPVLAANGHNYGELIAKIEPTCEDKGQIAHYKCSVCQKTFDADKKDVTNLEIPANGHNYGELIAKIEPTCEDKGQIAHYKCSVCKKTFDSEKNEVTDLEIPANGHNYGELIAEVPATCEGTGVIAHYKCSVCEKTFNTEKAEVTDLVIPANGHNYGDLIAKVEPTTEKDGTKEHYQCSACSKYFDANKAELDSIVILKLPVLVTTPEEPEWKKGSDEGLTFVSDAPFDLFDSVMLNGVALQSGAYEAKADANGQTVIVISPEYLDALDKGDYSIEIKSDNGSCKYDFTLKGNGAVTVIIIVVAVLVIVGGAAGAIVILKKKNIIK